MPNYNLQQLPPRTIKPRKKGLTIVLDKGLSLREVENLLSVAASYIDMVKLGWCTSYLTPNLQEKINLYQKNHIKVFLGGTLFEAFIVRNQFNNFRKTVAQYQLQYVEISNGSITTLSLKKKCHYIEQLAKEFTVLSEVGTKNNQKQFTTETWIASIKEELTAGAWKIIAEARESGNAGIFNSNGEVDEVLIQNITTQIDAEKIIWETPQKIQQTWFIKKIGSNVNLGNIAYHDVIPLETLRLGLRSDTFYHFLSL